MTRLHLDDTSRSLRCRLSPPQAPCLGPNRPSTRPSTRVLPATLWAGAIAALAALQACGPGTEPGPAPHRLAPGSWRATLASPGGAITFGLDVEESEGGLRAVLVNGEERQPAGLIEAEGDGEQLRFQLPPYRSAIVATPDPDGRGLTGYWERDLGEGPTPLLPFAAVAGTDTRPPAQPDAAAQDRISGRWRVRFEGDEQDAVGLFEVAPHGRASGTFLTTLGDYRYLNGWFDGEALRLGCFDGAHAFLFEARLDREGGLRGDFWSRDSFHTTWTATRDDEAGLPDDFELTRWTEGEDLKELAFPDVNGETQSLGELLPAESAGLLVVFGTWCPNCNDLTKTLVRLQGRHPDLRIVGLAFELGTDPAKHREAVRGYVAHHGIKYPVLVGGSASKTLASEALPIVDRVRAYPTTVFLARGRRPTAVHTGFSGPATGQRHEALVDRFESEIEALIGAR